METVRKRALTGFPKRETKEKRNATSSFGMWRAPCTGCLRSSRLHASPDAMLHRILSSSLSVLNGKKPFQSVITWLNPSPPGATPQSCLGKPTLTLVGTSGRVVSRPRLDGMCTAHTYSLQESRRNTFCSPASCGESTS